MRKYKVFTVIVLTFALILGGSPFSYGSAEANDENFEKSIWEYKHENYEEAHKLLVPLREKYPESSMVAYYLGITYKKMQDYKKALPNLEAAVTLKPKVKNALPELIDVLYKKGKLKEAKEWIAVGEKENIYPAQMAFQKGLVLLKEGDDIDGAIASFEKAKELDPATSSSADYYIGLAHLKAKHLEQAKDIFRNIVIREPGANMASFADQYVNSIVQRQESTRLFRGNVGTSTQYDDNVVLSPGDGELVSSIGNKADWRQTYTLNTELNKQFNEHFGAQGGYSLYVGKQFDLGFYDTTSHSGYIQPTVYLDKVAIGFPVRYNFVTVNDKGYLSTVEAGNLTNIQLGRNQMGQVGLLYKNEKYLWAPSGPGEDRNSDEYWGHIGWFYFFGNNKGLAHLKYTINYDDTDGDNWRYIGNKITMVMTVPLTEKLKLSGTCEANFQRFTETNFIFKQKRRDDVLTLSGLLSYEVFKNAEVQLNFTHTNNESNIRAYDYKRNLYSLGVKYSF